MDGKILKPTPTRLTLGSWDPPVDQGQLQKDSYMRSSLVQGLGNLLRYWSAHKKKLERLSIVSSKGIVGLVTLSEKSFQLTLNADILQDWMDEKFEFQEIQLVNEDTSACPDTSKTEKQS